MEQCLQANSWGGSNPDALRQMQTLGLHLKWTSSLLGEKAGSLVHWAEILYSPRRHARWTSAYQSGAEAVAHFMRCNLVSIKTIIDRMSDCP
jgi:hypothetical protein